MAEFLVVSLLIYLAVKADEVCHHLKTIAEELKSIGEEPE